MFNSLLSKLAVVAATAVVGLGAVSAPAHALGKTLSGQFENGFTYSGSFEAEDKSGGGAIEFDKYGFLSGSKKNELTAFTMSIFSEGKVVASLGLEDLIYFIYSDKGALNGDVVLEGLDFFDGLFIVGNNNISVEAADYGFGAKKQGNFKFAEFKLPNGEHIYTEVIKSEIGNLQSVPESNSQSVPEPASMLGLLGVSAVGISTLKRKKKTSSINIPSRELTGV